MLDDCQFCTAKTFNYRSRLFRMCSAENRYVAGAQKLEQVKNVVTVICII